MIAYLRAPCHFLTSSLPQNKHEEEPTPSALIEIEMGANQSTDGSKTGFAQPKTREGKTCYYELLGIDLQASDEEWAFHYFLSTQQSH